MMKKGLKVIHIELKQQYNGKTHYYFGSKTAVYKHLTVGIIGIKKTSLWNVDLDEKPYENRLCIIRAGQLYRVPTMRGKVKKMKVEKTY
ncbi:MAG: hypothetical protein LBE04_01835 [Prevotellaceae bacterium]|jgi:hypothetical protein|nr:hypothetical protein [Prevotellaceae bacterium]